MWREKTLDKLEIVVLFVVLVSLVEPFWVCAMMEVKLKIEMDLYCL